MDVARTSLHPGLQSVLDTALDAVVVIGVDDRILGWNGKAESTFGWSRSDALGSPLASLIIPERYRSAHACGMVKFLETGEGPVLDRLIEIEALCRDGNEISIELSITASDQFGPKLFIGFLRDISNRAKQAEQRERLLRELNHRVKNSLSLVTSIAHMTAQNSTSVTQFMSAFSQRLQSLAAGHDLLVESEWGRTDIGTIVGHVLGAAVAAGRAECCGPKAEIASNRVIGLAMILHELFTNASKYGALASEDGILTVGWREDDGQIILEWSELGVTGLQPPPSEGFGLSMIAMSVRHDLGGSQIQQWRPEGLRMILRFPTDG